MSKESEALAASIRADKARNLRYKKGALSTIGWEPMMSEFYDIEEACQDVHWYFDGEDGDSLLSSMDGDEEESFEIKMAFAELEVDCNRLREMIEEIRDYEGNGVGQVYDDCTVALIGNRYEILGYDAVEEDYFSLTHFEQELSVTTAGERVTRWTKADMLRNIGRCMSIAFAFIDLRDRYNHLRAVMDVLKGENMAILRQVKEIEKEYEKMWDTGSDYEFDRLLRVLPDRLWVE